MPLRSSPRNVRGLEDLNDMDKLVVDKRLGQRSSAKRSRRNRHYENQFIRNALSHHSLNTEIADVDLPAPATAAKDASSG